MTSAARLLIFAFAAWLSGLVFIQVGAIAVDPVWQGYQFGWSSLAVFGALSATGFLLSFFVKRSVAPGAWHLGFTAFAAITWSALCLLIPAEHDFVASAVVLAIAYLMARAGQLVIRPTGFGCPIWLGFCAASVVLHHGLIALMAAGLATPAAVAGLVAVLAVPGLIDIVKHPATTTVTRTLKVWSAFDLFACVVLILLLLLSLAYGSFPQTYADGLVYRLPYLQEIAATGRFPEPGFHFYRLMPHPITVLMLPGFFLAGESGAFFSVWCISAACASAYISFTARISGSRSAALLAAVLFFSAPPVWLLTTVLYTDIAIVFYILAGLLLLDIGLAHGKAAGSNSRSALFFAAVSLGFAASIKLNAGLFVIMLAIPFIALRLRAIFNVRSLAALGAGGVVGLGPWLGVVWARTGNPLYPFAPAFTKPEFRDATVFTPDALVAFGFPLSPLTLIRLPWDLTFQSSRFGEYIDATFGIALLALIPLLALLTIPRLRAKLFEPSLAPWLAVASIAAFLLTIVMIKMAIFRYSLSAFAVLLGVLSTIFIALMPFAKQFATALVIFCLGFLLVAGDRLNYGISGNAAEAMLTGSLSRRDFVQARSQGIDELINRCTKPGDTVISTAFFLINLLEPKTFFATTTDALFGNMRSLDRFERFIAEQHTRFWIYDPTYPQTFLDGSGIAERYLTPERIAFGGGGFVVFDLKAVPDVTAGTELKWAPVSTGAIAESIVGTSADPLYTDLPLPAAPNASVKGSARLIAATESSALIDIIFFDAKDTEVGRSSVATLLLPNQPKLVPFAVNAPQNSARTRLIVHPWRPTDGAVTITSSQAQAVAMNGVCPATPE